MAVQFLTKTERKKCKKMQTILHGGCYLLFEGYLQEKKYRFLSWVRPCRRIGQSFEESHEEVRLLRTWKIFEKQLLNSTIVYMMQRIMLISEAFTYPPWMIILLDLDNYPHHTQLYSTTWSGGTRWEMNCLSAETFLVRLRDGISTGSFCRYSMLPSIRTLQFNIVITLLC